MGLGLGLNNCTAERLAARLAVLATEWTEYMVHVARKEDVARGHRPVGRSTEYAVLSSAALPAMLAEHRVTLASFRDL